MRQPAQDEAETARYHVWRCLDCGTLFRTSNSGRTARPISEEEARRPLMKGPMELAGIVNDSN